MKKKGIFFTFIAITIITIFMILLTPKANISLQKDDQAIKTKINSVDSYVSDLQGRYLEDVLRATTQKAILSMIFYMNSTGSYIKNFDAKLPEIILNGTINGVPIDSITGKKIMNNNTLTNWSNRIIQTAYNTLNVNTTIKILNVSVSQTTPWSLDAKAIVNFTVTSSVAEWEKSVTLMTEISIEELYDPYYLVNTGGAYTNKIKKSSVDFSQWNISKVREHLRNGTYAHWQGSEAPSFLMRFVNDTTNSSCCGIESLVNPNMVIPSDQMESYVDYQFWNRTYQSKCSEIYNITNPPASLGLWDEFPYFKLDLDHLAKYNITSQDSKKTC